MAESTGQIVILTRFLDLMHEVRLVLKSGDLTCLPDLTRRQQALSETVQSLSCPGSAEAALLDQVKLAAARNARLLKAAGRGIAEAGRRHRERAELLVGARTYNCNGKAETLAPVGLNLRALNRRS